ncbi:MAG: UvrD-helicase domain-containing protein [Clostridia bacterium]|nr:UvrD-helicase domain-containing protein [Clostridia bacterium]
MNEILDKLNEEQIKPVMDTEGAVLVIAGAGSGKTRVLTSRIAYLVKEKDVSPRNVMAITFTNKAADEMKERLNVMLDDVEGMWVSTIHGMCTRILRQNIPFIGYDKNFTIYSDADKDRVLKRIFDGLQFDDEKFLKNAKWHISNAKMLGLPPKKYHEEMQDVKDIEKYCSFYELYEETLKASNALDFDDLLLKTRDILANFEEVRNYYSEKFRYVHIDEFQDTNAVQYEIVKLLVRNHGNLFVVGDDDQSIYGWRGAEIRNILDFENDFIGAKVYKLERNYRSTKRILSLANAIIKNNTERKKKVLWTANDDGVRVETYTASDETNEAMYAAVQIKSLLARGYHAGDFAVLMRINAISRVYEQEFIKYGIPYKVFGGFKFYERKEIKDLMAYFRILVNPLDTDAILRIINVPKRGIGEKTIELMLDYAKNKGMCLYDSISDIDELDLPPVTKGRINNFRQLIVSLIIDKETLGLKDLLGKVLEKTNYLSLFEADTEENYTKRANVGELQNSIEEFVKLNADAGLTDFLNSVTLSSDIDEMDDGDYVTLATIHAVKGLEFRSVFICGLEETVFPISRAGNKLSELEEERRLMYVAITRAEERLYITNAQSRYLFGERQFTVKSRFLSELAPELGLPAPKTKIGTDDGYIRRVEERKPAFGYNDEGADAPPRSFGGYSSAGAKRFSEAQKLKPQVQPDAFVNYTVGKKVRHAKFGEGTIVAIKGSGASKVADVAFKGVGVKSLSIKFAPMELLEK